MNLHTLRALYMRLLTARNVVAWTDGKPLHPSERDDLVEALSCLRDACNACDPPQDPDRLAYFLTDVQKEPHGDSPEALLASAYDAWKHNNRELPEGANSDERWLEFVKGELES
jgi:hypothetical protein